MVDFQLDILNKLNPDGEEPKGVLFDTRKELNIRHSFLF